MSLKQNLEPRGLLKGTAFNLYEILYIMLELSEYSERILNFISTSWESMKICLDY